jgi:hypothetical protein
VFEADALWAQEYQDFVQEVSFAGPGEAIDFVDALAACTRLVAVAHEGHEREMTLVRSGA